MTDLNTTAIATATSAGMISITGGIFGLHFDTLIVGFLAGLVALSFQDQQSYVRMVSSVFSSAIVAACFAPWWAATILHYAPYLSTVGPEASNVASAAAIGLITQTVVPVALERLKSLIASLSIGGSK